MPGRINHRAAETVVARLKQFYLAIAADYGGTMLTADVEEFGLGSTRVTVNAHPWRLRVLQKCSLFECGEVTLEDAHATVNLV